MYDIIVIGGGVSGMTAALYSLRNGKKVLLIEGDSVGGQIAQSPKVENYPTIKQISGAKLSEDLFDQISALGVDFEFDKIDGEYALDILYTEVGPELLQTQLDTCWVNVGGENPADYIRKYSGRAPGVHLKDFFGEKSDDMYERIGIDKKAPTRPSGFEFRPVGMGLQNFPAILEAAKAAGSEWVVVEQDQATMGLTPLESIKKSIDYLKSFEW